MAVSSENTKTVEELNETGRRSGEDRRQEDSDVSSDRREVQRRRQIDPTTCERDYSGDEIEFMQALDLYKRRSGRMFPTCSEILEVLIEMGYRRVYGPEGELLEIREPTISAQKPADVNPDEADDADASEE